MKKLALVISLAMALPFAASAESATPAKAKTTAKAKKSTAKKSAAKKTTTAAASAAAIQGETLSAEELAVAQKVFTGHIRCELGASVNVEADPRKAGYFMLTHNKVNYSMRPVSSLTGAVRLEDTRSGAMWLQLANKSMLMNQRQGQRLADECQSEAQIKSAEEIRRNPPQNIFDTPAR